MKIEFSMPFAEILKRDGKIVPFDPSKIKNAIDQAQNDIEFGIMVFTENSLGDAVIDAQQRGLNIDGIIDYVEYTGSEYQYLKDNGVNVRDYVNPDGSSWPDGPVFHHKYVLMDFQEGATNPILITGSHNWSAAAESNNDENTLIIYDANIANQFHQEFSKRFKDLQTPIAVDDDTVANTNEWITINYLENDFIPEDIAVSLEIVQIPSNGEAEWVQGEMSYKSGEQYSGKDSLSYRIYNINNPQLSDTAWVRIQVGENSINELSGGSFNINKQYLKQGTLYLDIYSRKTETLHLNLFDLESKLINSSSIMVVTGSNSYKIKLGTLSKGVYLLDVSNTSEKLSSKLIY